MQVSIDSAKRRFDIDIDKEIKRIKKDMNIIENGYPIFWLSIKKGFKKDKINPNLKCPMNYLSSLKFNKFRNNTSTLPMSDFFVKFELEKDRRICKKVESLIEKYSLDLYSYNLKDELNNNEYLLLRADFDEMIRDISQIYISNTYIGLMSWLIDRAFCITSDAKRHMSQKNSNIEKNKSILFKTLYNINHKNFLKIWNK